MQHEIARLQEAQNELQTTQRQLEDALPMQQRIMAFSVDVICTVDGEGRFSRISAAGEKTWGYPAHELIGRKYMEMVHPDDCAETERIATAIMSGQSTEGFCNRYLHRNGSTVDVERHGGRIWVESEPERGSTFYFTVAT